MSQFKKLTGLRTYEFPLQRDLREIERYLRDLGARVDRLSTNSSVNNSTSGPQQPGASLITHAHTHATGGSVLLNTGSDPLRPYSYTWSNEHSFSPNVTTYVPITITPTASQTSRLLASKDSVGEVVFELNSESRLGMNQPTTFEAVATFKRGGTSLEPDQISNCLFWHRMDDSQNATNGAATPSTYNLPNRVANTTYNFDVGRGLAGAGLIFRDSVLNTHDALEGTNNATHGVGFREILNGGANYSTGTGAYTYVCIYYALAAGSMRVLGGYTASGNGFSPPIHHVNAGRCFVLHAGTSEQISINENPGAGDGFDTTTQAISGQYHCAIIVRSAGGVYTYYHNGVDRTSSPPITRTTAITLTNLMLVSTAAPAPTGVQLLEQAYYTKALSSTEVNGLMGYINNRYANAGAGVGLDGPLMHFKDVEDAVMTEVSETGYVHIGGADPLVPLQVTSTTQQAKIRYDASNYLDITVASDGSVTLDLTGTTPDFNFLDTVNILGDLNVTGQTTLTSGANEELLIVRPYAGITTATPCVRFQDFDGTTHTIIDKDGYISSPTGTEALLIKSRTNDVDPFTVRDSFIFAPAGGATGRHTKWQDTGGNTVMNLEYDGQLYFGSTSSTAYVHENYAATFTVGQKFSQWISLKAIVVPSNPSPTYWHLFVNDADDHLYKMKSDGSLTDLEAPGTSAAHLINAADGGSTLAARTYLAFFNGLSATDDVADDQTNVVLDVAYSPTWTGNHIFDNGITLNDGYHYSDVANGAAAIAHHLDSLNSLTNADDRYVLRVSNAGFERMSLTAGGRLSLPGVAGSYTAGLAVGPGALFLTSSKSPSYIIQEFSDFASGTGAQTIVYQTTISPSDLFSGASSTVVAQKNIASVTTGSASGTLLTATGLDNEVTMAHNTWTLNNAFACHSRMSISPTAGTTLTLGSAYIYNAGLTVSNNHTLALTNFTYYLCQSPTWTNATTTQIPNFRGVWVNDLTNRGYIVCDAISVDAQTSYTGGTRGNIRMAGGAYDNGHLQLATGHIWFDGTNLRGKNSAPTSASDGGKLVLSVAQTYTPTNVTTDRSYDANSTSIDELADVLGTLIADLQSSGVIS